MGFLGPSASSWSTPPPPTGRPTPASPASASPASSWSTPLPSTGQSQPTGPPPTGPPPPNTSGKTTS